MSRYEIYFMKNTKLFVLIIFLSSTLFIGCSNNNLFKNNNNISQATGWKISTKDGGFKNKKSYKGQVTGPGLVFVEGGTYTKGNVQDKSCMIGIILQLNNTSDSLSTKQKLQI